MRVSFVKSLLRVSFAVLAFQLCEDRGSILPLSWWVVTRLSQHPILCVSSLMKCLGEFLSCEASSFFFFSGTLLS